MRIFRILFLFLFNIPIPFLHGQVLAPDYIYIRTPPKVKPEPNAFLLNYFLPQLLDSSSSEKLRKEVANINSDFSKKPLAIENCVYFDALAKKCISSSGEGIIENLLFTKNFFAFGFPPSLRFSTDEGKNYVDSLFSIHFFPKVQLEDYVQPFYFKKTEVTNAEYREFVSYVRDSIARKLLAENGFEDQYLLSTEQLIKIGYHEDSIPEDPYKPLNWNSKVDYNSDIIEYKQTLEPMYLPAGERFWHRKEFDTRKLIYTYFTIENGEKYKHHINVYPDTLCWVHDFSFFFSEPMTNMYNWHPAYDNYPVVGISFNQAKAFLHWKTETEQKKLNAKGIKYNVKYDLPSEIEWEIASTSVKQGKKIYSYGNYFNALADESWLTDLMLDSSAFVNEKVKVILDSIVTEIEPKKSTSGDGIYLRENVPSFLISGDSVYEKDGKKYNLHRNWYYWSSARTNFLNNNSSSSTAVINFNLDNHFFACEADLEKTPTLKTIKGSEVIDGKKVYKETRIDNTVILTQLDDNGISFMGGNVSEWLDEDYSDWLPAFNTRLKMLRAVNTSDAQMEFQREYYFNSRNAKNGKLVRGANWFDERYGNFLKKNPAGANAKCFVNPAKSHSTIGFRYVVHITKK